jgi:hypothetical protein
MSKNQDKIAYRSLHAPQDSGEALIDPPMAEFAGQITAFFRTRPTGARVCFGAKSALLHRIEARVELFRSLVEDLRVNSPIVMVGHQPQVFHPGVGLKNCVTSRLAQRTSGTAVNLIVDNDLMKSASIVTPSRGSEGATTQVAFDADADAMPSEEREFVDFSQLESFAARVEATMPSADWRTMLIDRWPPFLALWKSLNPDKNFGRLISAFRQSMEAYWGFPTFDLPLSVAVSTRAFAQLALEIFQDAHEFAKIYNACLAEYRKTHRLRSRSHPAPDLEITSNTEVELPFWLWTTATPHRKRAYIRRLGDTVTVTDRVGIEWSANLSDGEALIDRLILDLLIPPALTDANRPKLRPKALITTLYARYLLCDGFVHGIGGAKYDQVTEAIAARWGLGTLAPMQCATMTLRLPLDMKIVNEQDVRQKRQTLRDLIHHPEEFIEKAQLAPGDSTRARELIEWKRKWIADRTPERMQERHRAITRLNAELAAMLRVVRSRYETELADALAKFARQQPWLSREFPAVLFPEELLKSEFSRVTDF